MRKLLHIVLQRIISLQMTIFLGIIFFTAIPVIALIHFFFRKKQKKTGWVTWSVPSETIQDVERQY